MSAAVVLGMGFTVLVTLALAAYSSRLARTTGDFYVAGRSVPAWWNASAISGEYLSAASFLGVAGLIMVAGADAVWFPVGYAVGYVLLLALVAAPLRRSGAYTVPDFCESRLRSTGVRTAASILVVLIGWLYVVPQLQGAGLALQTLLGTPPWVGGALVSVTVLAVIVGGGMRSVTLVQGFQYWLKLVALMVPVLFLLAAWHVDGSPSAISGGTPVFAEDTSVQVDAPITVDVVVPVTVTAEGVIDGTAVNGDRTLAAGPHDIAAGTTVGFPAGAAVPHIAGTPALSGSAWSQPLQGDDHALYRTYATMIALFLGTMGLPHVLTRFYTNPDGRAARRTALFVIGFVGLFYLVPSVYGMLGRLYAPELLMTGRSDAVVLLLPQAIVGGSVGQLLTSLVSAGAAAAFLATATGLTVTVAAVLSQDVVRRRVSDPIASFRIAAVAAVLAPLLLGLLASALPVAEGVALAFAVAASTFCPLLLLGIWWPRLTDVGAAAGLVVGGGLALTGILLSLALPGLDGWPDAILSQPAAWAMQTALLTMVVVSRATKHRVRADVGRIMIRLHTPESVRLQRTWTARGRR